MMASMTWEPTLAGDMLIDDQIYDILLRLPVKSLLRFKSVSKSWLFLISNPYFIKSHTIRKRKAADEETLIVLYHRLMYPLNLDSYEIESCIDFYYSRYVEEEQPYTTVVGCYNGVVCLCLTEYSEIILWNPATKLSKPVPWNIIGCAKFLNDDFVDPYEIRSVRTGFGFDPQTNDFKVVKFVRSRHYPICAEVYSANNNGWRVLDEPNLIDIDYRFDVCANGFLCYLSSDGMMVVFDLNKEVFMTGVKLPVDDGASVCITDVNDTIAVVTISKMVEGLNGCSKIRLWTLDDNACLRIGGVDAVWTQMLSIDVDTKLGCVNVYFNNGDLILVCEHDHYWYVYDTDKKESRLLLISIKDHPLCNTYDSYKKKPVSMRRFFKYRESLFTIPGSSFWNSGSRFWNSDDY